MGFISYTNINLLIGKTLQIHTLTIIIQIDF